MDCDPCALEHSVGMALLMDAGVEWAEQHFVSSLTIYYREPGQGQDDWQPIVIVPDRKRRKRVPPKFGITHRHLQLLRHADLTPGRLYEVGVTGTNAAGEGPMSEIIEVCWPVLHQVDVPDPCYNP